MKKSAISGNERARISALRNNQILGLGSDPVFDSITRNAARICGTPIAAITLIDDVKQWFESVVGLQITQLSLDNSFCAQTILEPSEFLEVKDALMDSRFQSLPLVTDDPHIRYYAGQTLTSSDGHVLGTLCVFDHKPNQLSSMQKTVLAQLAETVNVLFDNHGLPTSQLGRALDKDPTSYHFMLDPSNSEATISYCNVGFAELAGYSVDDVIGQPLSMLYGRETNLQTIEVVKLGIRNGQVINDDIVIYKANGESFQTRLRIAPVFDEHNQLAQMVGRLTSTNTDDDIHRKLDQARLFLDSAPDATLIVGTDGRIILANREAEYLFGYPHEELLDMSIETLMPERYRIEHLSHRKEYSNNPTVRDMGAGLSIKALTNSGAEVPIDIRLSPIETDGEKMIAASIRDITTRMNFELALEKAKDLAERATLEKSRFLATASHDLRQPLQAIGLYLSVLERTNEAEIQSEVMHKMRLSLDNITSMLGALLDVSKLDSGAVEPDKQNIELQPILDKIIAGSQQQADRKGLTLRCSHSSATIYSDASLLERVLDNFVTNAIRYTEHGSVSIESRVDGNQLAIEVIDTGIGIDADEIDRIFEEYYQLDNPMRNRNKGLGLGLSIVKHISRLLGHTVDVRSERGKGSIFSITVPLVSNSETQPQFIEFAKPPTDDLRDTKSSVILIDDDPAVLDSTSILLKLAGVHVMSCSNGEECLKLIDEGLQPTALISDYRLPGINGTQLVQIAREKLGSELPAIIITGDTGSDELVNANLPNCSVLHKPIDTEKLIEKLRSINRLRK